jgi:hypothetical protein
VSPQRLEGDVNLAFGSFRPLSRPAAVHAFANPSLFRGLMGQH